MVGTIYQLMWTYDNESDPHIHPFAKMEMIYMESIDNKIIFVIDRNRK